MSNNLHVVLSDVHVPFMDVGAVKMAVDFIKEQKPNTVHLLGDIADAWSLSRFDKDPMRRLNLQEELDSVRDWLVLVRDTVPKAKIIYSEGNHEFRLRKYLRSEAKALAGLRALTLEKLLDFDRLKIHWQPQDRPYRIGSLLFTHGQCCSKWSGQTARQHYEKYGCCVIHGHTHRLGAFYHRNVENVFGCWENGCLCSLNPDYVTTPDWQHGFSVVWNNRDRFHVEQIALIGGVYCYHGKTHGRKTPPAHTVDEL